MADGDYERGRDREIASLAAQLRRLRVVRSARGPRAPRVLVLNGWAASPQAWDLCRFPRERIFTYLEQLDGLPERVLTESPETDRFILVGWSMGGSGALRLAAAFPGRVAGLVLVGATPRMMEEKETGWRGMSPRRLEALRYGVELTRGAGLFGVPEGKPNPYLVDTPENLNLGIRYLLETDIRADLERTFPSGTPQPFPVHIFQSERDGIVRAANADYLKRIFPSAEITRVPGTEHALSILIPEEIDAAVARMVAISSTNE